MREGGKAWGKGRVSSNAGRRRILWREDVRDPMVPDCPLGSNSIALFSPCGQRRGAWQWWGQQPAGRMDGGRGGDHGGREGGGGLGEREGERQTRKQASSLQQTLRVCVCSGSKASDSREQGRRGQLRRPSLRRVQPLLLLLQSTWPAGLRAPRRQRCLRRAWQRCQTARGAGGGRGAGEGRGMRSGEK
jgi:hypothetical protein